VDVYIEFLGFAASLVSLVLWWPQAIRVWHGRRSVDRLSGVSISSQVLLLTNAALWGAYAVITGSLWVGVAGAVNAPLAVATIVILHSGRRERPRLTPAGATDAGAG